MLVVAVSVSTFCSFYDLASSLPFHVCVCPSVCLCVRTYVSLCDMQLEKAEEQERLLEESRRTLEERRRKEASLRKKLHQTEVNMTLPHSTYVQCSPSTDR